MRIITRGALFNEIIKIKNVIKNKDAKILEKYYEEYISSLKVSSKEVFHMGCFTLYSENISYHLLSIYYLLDLIDFHYDGKKFLDNEYEENILLSILSNDEYRKIKGIVDCKKTIYELQKLSRSHRLHIFLIPHEFKDEYSLEITYPGNIMVLYPNKVDENEKEEKTSDILKRGICEFYFKKQMRGILPRWSDTYEDFETEFIKWSNGLSSKFSGRRME